MAVDDIHSELDNLIRSSKRKELLEQAIAKANQTLLLTVPLTTPQTLKLVELAMHAVGAGKNVCIYEFRRVKSNSV